MAESPIAVAAPYLERLAVNEYVQDRLLEAGLAVGAAGAVAAGVLIRQKLASPDASERLEPAPDATTTAPAPAAPSAAQ